LTKRPVRVFSNNVGFVTNIAASSCGKPHDFERCVGRQGIDERTRLRCERPPPSPPFLSVLRRWRAEPLYSSPPTGGAGDGQQRDAQVGTRADVLHARVKPSASLSDK
jgi:hypothetical protein